MELAYLSIQEISCELVTTVIMVKKVAPPVLVLAGPEMNLSTSVK